MDVESTNYLRTKGTRWIMFHSYWGYRLKWYQQSLIWLIICGTYKFVVWLSYKIKVIKCSGWLRNIILWCSFWLSVRKKTKSLFLKINCPLLVFELNTKSYKYVLIDTVGTSHPTICIDRTDEKFWRRSCEWTVDK